MLKTEFKGDYKVEFPSDLLAMAATTPAGSESVGESPWRNCHKILMAKSSTTVERIQDEPPSKNDGLPRSLKILQRNLAKFKQTNSKPKKSKATKKSDLPIRKTGESFFQFVRRVNEAQDDISRSNRALPTSVSSSTKRYREKRKERIQKKKSRRQLDLSATLPADVVKFNEVADAPPKISQIPKKKNNALTTASRKDAAMASLEPEEQLRALISVRRKDLERERMRQSYKQAKEARHRALSCNELMNGIKSEV